MKTTEIVGYKRTQLGKADSKRLRADSNVPCVLYSKGGEAIHFHTPMYLFRNLLDTPNTYIVVLNLEGEELKCILQDVQFHPVNEMILHADFLQIYDDVEVSIDVPVTMVGKAPGAQSGGQVYVKNKKLKVKALPGVLPEFVNVDISTLDLGASVRVKDLPAQDYKILTNENVSIVQIIIPRALKAALQATEDEEETAAAEA